MALASVLLAIFALAGFDFWFTRRQINVVGKTAVEMNAAAKWLVAQFGTEVGLFLGIIVPSGLIAAALSSLSPKNPSLILVFSAVLLGMRLQLAFSQTMYLTRYAKIVETIIERDAQGLKGFLARKR
jgi:hypothetical protein